VAGPGAFMEQFDPRCPDIFKGHNAVNAVAAQMLPFGKRMAHEYS